MKTEKVIQEHNNKITKKDFYAISFFLIANAWMLKSVSLFSIANNNFRYWGNWCLIISLFIALLLKIKINNKNEN